MKTKTIIKEYRHRLKWPVTDITGSEVGPLRITSDHIKKTHTIYLPDHDVREIEYLHEIGHAYLCEWVNPMFGTQYFARSVTPAQINEIQPASQGASDWFCDQWLFEITPAAEKAEISESMGLIISQLQRSSAGGPELFCMAVLIFAQAQKYCGEKLNMGEPLKSGVAGLLAINPANPTVAKLQAAVNVLLSCYSNLRVKHIIDSENIDCWEVLNE